MAGVTRFRFGVFEADEHTGELTKSGRLVHVQHQPFRALIALLERSGRLVTREELRAVLWSEATHVDFDRGLNFALRRLRIALGDDPRQPCYIETVPRRGYRFVAPVTRLPAADEVGKPAPAPVAARRPETRKARRQLALLGLALFLMLATGPRSPAPAPAVAPKARAAFAQGEALARTCRRRESVAHFREALRVDPRYAAAHAALADVYLALGEQGELLPGEAFPRARAEAERALSLEEGAEARLVLGAARFYYDWDWAGARRELERAVALEPDSPTALTTLARYLSAAGEHERAIALVGHAEALDPSSPLVVHEAGWVYARARRFDDAMRKFRQAGTLPAAGGGNRAEWTKWNRLHVMLIHQRTGSAVAAREDALEIMRLSNVPQVHIDRIGALEPARAVALVLEKSLEIARGNAGRDYVPPVRLAVLSAALGRDEDALSWLSRAQELRTPSLVYALADPLFDHLRSHPRFRILAAQVAPPLA
jgi:DNA-binding winged helix-turn-helix (wHTH) protein/Tfp pilus assembly protein PilF